MACHLDLFVPYHLNRFLADLALYPTPVVILWLRCDNVLVIVFDIRAAENWLSFLVEGCALLFHQFATQISETDPFVTGTFSYYICYKMIVRGSLAAKLF